MVFTIAERILQSCLLYVPLVNCRFIDTFLETRRQLILLVLPITESCSTGIELPWAIVGGQHFLQHTTARFCPSRWNALAKRVWKCTSASFLIGVGECPFGQVSEGDCLAHGRSISLWGLLLCVCVVWRGLIGWVASIASLEDRRRPTALLRRHTTTPLLVD